jgi:hypothetical protein
LKRQCGQRQKIKKKSAIRRGGERDKVAPMRRRNPGMDIGQAGRFPAQCRPVVNNLELDLLAGVIDDWHGSPESSSSFRRAQRREFVQYDPDFFTDARLKRPVVMDDG